MAMLSDLAPNIAKSAKMNSKEFITMRSKKESIGVAIIIILNLECRHFLRSSSLLEKMQKNF